MSLGSGERLSRGPAMIGAIVGFGFGAAMSTSSPGGSGNCLFALPGTLLGIATGLLQSGGTKPGFQALSTLVNASFYGIIGVLVAWRVSQRKTARVSVPRCCICGFRWPDANSTTCPKCHTAGGIPANQGGKEEEYQCECGYDLTGNVSGVCPECGNPVV